MSVLITSTPCCRIPTVVFIDFSYSDTSALLEHGVEYMVGPGPKRSAPALCATEAVTLANFSGKPLFATGVVGLWANLG